MNISSSSLEGMERPVRSFRSFIKTVPPNPSPSCSDKPLPPTPFSSQEPSPPLSSKSTPESPQRNPSIASWKAPAEWFNSNPELVKSYPGTPPLPRGRQLSPLLPEPSPDIGDKFMEIQTVQAPATPSQLSRLVPIYERSIVDLGPPPPPPRSPLPLPPKAGVRLAPLPIPPITSIPYREKESPPIPIFDSVPTSGPSREPSSGNPSVNHDLRAASPSLSAASGISDESTKEKAFASLGIGSPSGEAGAENYRETSEHDRPDQRYIRGKKLRALNKGNPLSDDSWEDPDLDEKARQLSFSQDYHDLLVDQYQELNVQPQEILRHAPPKTSPPIVQNNIMNLRNQQVDQKLVPRPLSWQKSSSNSSPRSESRNENTNSTTMNNDNPKVRKHRLSGKFSAWVPNRLSVGSHRKDSNGTTLANTSKRPGKGLRGVAYTDTSPRSHKVSEEKNKKDQRFFHFLPAGKPLQFMKKSKSDRSLKAVKTGPLPATHPSSTTCVHRPLKPMVRLPGGFAVIRTPSEPRPQSNHASFVDISHQSADRPPSATLPESICSSIYTNSTVPTPSQQRQSYISQQSNSTESRGPVARNKLRMSVGSSRSRHSSGSNHPLANETTHTSSHSPASTGSSWIPFSGDPDLAQHKPGFLEKAIEARRKHSRELRQKKLKDSIKVLGPTDPHVVAGYVRGDESGEANESGRKPGYLVDGS